MLRVRSWVILALSGLLWQLLDVAVNSVTETRLSHPDGHEGVSNSFLEPAPIHAPNRRLTTSLYNRTVDGYEVDADVHWNHIQFDTFAPASIEEGYDARCDTTSLQFVANNSAILEGAGIRKFALCSLVGLFKFLWLLFKLVLPLVFPPKFPIAPIQDWIARGEPGDRFEHHPFLGRKKERKDRFAELKKKSTLSDDYVNYGEAVLSYAEGLGDDDRKKFEDKHRFGSEYEASSYDLKTNYDNRFFDPQDIHQAASLDVIIPSSPNFDLKKANAYVAARLDEPVKKGFVSMPWSQRTQIFVFIGQVVQGMSETARTLILDEPGKDMLPWHVSWDWFYLTFRPEVLLPFLYQFARAGILVQTLSAFFSGQVANYVAAFFFAVFLLTVCPFVPVLFLFCVLSACGLFSLGTLDNYLKRRGFNKLSSTTLPLYVCFQLAVVPAIGFASKSGFWPLPDTSATYLCSFSQLQLISPAPGSLSNFFVTIGVVVALAAAMAAAACCLPRLLTPEYAYVFWLDKQYFNWEEHQNEKVALKEWKDKDRERVTAKEEMMRKKRTEKASHKHDLERADTTDTFTCSACLREQSIPESWLSKMRASPPQARWVCKHPDCAKTQVGEGKCPSGHALDDLGTSRDNGWGCDGRREVEGCASGTTGGGSQTQGMQRFRCEQCDYDLCFKCLDRQEKQKMKPGEEPTLVQKYDFSLCKHCQPYNTKPKAEEKEDAKESKEAKGEPPAKVSNPEAEPDKPLLVESHK